MRGLASTKMGALPVPGIYKGLGQVKFRYFRVYFPTNDRLYQMRHSWYIGPFGMTLHDVWLEEEPGVNLFWDNNTALTSDYWSASQLSTWHTARKTAQGGSSTSAIGVGWMVAPHVEIDLQYPRRLLKYGVCGSYPVHGWILLGSNDRQRWTVLNDTHPQYIFNTWDWVYSYQKWYFIDLATGLQPISFEAEHLYWGIVLGPRTEIWQQDISTEGTIEIAEFEFNDGVGGTDLLTGGSTVYGLSPSTTLPSANLYDDTTATSTYFEYGRGFCYKFSSPVLPVEVTITSGMNLEYSPQWFTVIYSDDERNWLVHSKFVTPESDWEPDSSWTKVAKTL